MSKGEREIGREILDGIREIQRGDHGHVTVHFSLDRDLYEQAKEEAGRRGRSRLGEPGPEPFSSTAARRVLERTEW